MPLYLKKLNKIISILILIFGLATPLLIFVNRFLIPDVSFDSLNYHLYLGFKGFNQANNKYEFFPTGIHNFSPILDVPGYIFSLIFGYRLGSIFSIVAIYITVFGLYKIFKLIYPKQRISDSPILSFLFVSSFLSFELFLGISSYYNDVVSACLGVWSVYFFIKYFKNNNYIDLIISIFISSVLIWGKQTNIYLSIGLLSIASVMIIGENLKIVNKIKKILLMGFVAGFAPLFWYLKNFLITGNPVFPFYNGIFKSPFFEWQNFKEIQFGGRNFTEKIGWGIYSIFDPPRLGQVHDLFNDYKINFYFIVILLSAIFFIFYNRNKLLTKFIWLYIIIFECWALIFGYIRYGLVLEFVGGLVVMMLFVELKSKFKWLVFIPILFFLILQNKRVINLSLAYDIGFRQGYYYNRISYPKELKNFGIKKIEINNDIKPDIYLNCANGGMTYYVLSPFKNLPVLNIDRLAYSGMTMNKSYVTESIKKLEPYLKSKMTVKFVTIHAKTGMNTEYVACLKNLKDRGFEVLDEKEISFLGYEKQMLGVIWGQFKIEDFDKITE